MAVSHIEVRWRDSTESSAWNYEILRPEQTSITIRGMSRDVQYVVEGRVVMDSGVCSDWARQVFTVNNNPFAPPAPTGLTTAGVADGIYLAWTIDGSAPFGTMYEVYRSVDGINWGPLPVAVVSGWTYTDAVTDGGTYYYRVRAVDYAGNFSEWSNVESNKAKEITDGADNSNTNNPANVGNPFFEAGDQGWTKGSGWTIEQDPVNAMTGAWLAKKNGGDATSMLLNDRIVPVSQGQYVVARAYAKASGANGTLAVAVQWFNSALEQVDIEYGNEIPAASAAGYTESYLQSIAPSNAFFAKFAIRVQNHTAGTWYVDNTYLFLTASTLTADQTMLLGGLSDVINDDLISIVEKPVVYDRWYALAIRELNLTSMANGLGITTQLVAYTAAMLNLRTYMQNTVGLILGSNDSVWLANPDSITIDGSVLRNLFASAYQTESALVKACQDELQRRADEAKEAADQAQIDADQALEDAGEAFLLAGQAAQEASAAFDAMEGLEAEMGRSIGGGNLFQNSSFEHVDEGFTVPKHWTYYVATWQGDTGVARQAEPGRRGGKCIEIEQTAWGGLSNWGCGLQDWDGSMMPQYLGGVWYTCSWYARAASASAVGKSMGLRWNTVPETQEMVTNPPLTTDWQRYVGRFRYNNTVTADFHTACLGGQAVGTKVQYDDIQLEEGEVVTAYVPKPNELLPGSITATEITDEAITTPKLAAVSVVASKIATDAIEARHVKAQQITADKLYVAGGTGAALNIDPGCLDISAWKERLGAAVTVAPVTDGRVGNSVLRSPVNGPGRWYYSLPVPVDRNKSYRFRCWRRGAAGSNGTFYLAVHLTDANGDTISGAGGGGGTWWYYVANNLANETEWTEHVGVVGAGTSKTFPSNARHMHIGVVLNLNGTIGYMEAQDVRIEEVIPGTLIQDGAITTNKVAAKAITAAQMVITNFNNIIPNPNSEEEGLANTPESANRYNAGSGAFNGSWVRRLVSEGLTYTICNVTGEIDIHEGMSFYMSCKCKCLQVTTATVRMAARVTFSDGTYAYWGSNDANNQITSWQTLEGAFNIDPDVKKPKSVMFYVQAINAPAGHIFDFDAFYAQRQNDGKLIVDGSIESRHIVSRSIETDRLKVGLGKNILFNGDFSSTYKIIADHIPNGVWLDNWTTWNPGGSTNQQFGINYSAATSLGSNQDLNNHASLNTVWMWQWDTSANDMAVYCVKQEVVPNQTYIASGYLGTRRAYAKMKLWWLDSAGSRLGAAIENAATGENLATHAGGTRLTDYKRVYIKATAPANAYGVQIEFNKLPTLAGQSNSFASVCRVQLEEVESGVLEPSPWSPTATTIITGNMVKSGIIQTADYTEVGGVPTQGARMLVTPDGSPPIRVAPSGIQIGSTTIDQTWFWKQKTANVEIWYSPGAGLNWANSGGISNVSWDDLGGGYYGIIIQFINGYLRNAAAVAHVQEYEWASNPVYVGRWFEYQRIAASVGGISGYLSSISLKMVDTTNGNLLHAAFPGHSWAFRLSVSGEG